MVKNIDFQKVWTDYQLGITLQKQAEKYNCTRQCLAINLRKMGHRLERKDYSHRPKNEINIDELIQLYNSKVKTKELAKKYNYSDVQIRNILNKNGIDTKNSGANHYNWKGGNSKTYKTIMGKVRHSNKYKNWRTKVFERDKYTCQNCFKTGVFLHAHHIKEAVS